MKRITTILITLFAYTAMQAQTSTSLKAKIDDSITNKTGTRSITAVNVGTRMKEVVDYAEDHGDSLHTAQKAYIDAAGALKENISNKSNATISYSNATTTAFPTQSAVKRLVDVRAGTDIGTPYVWYRIDSLGVVLSASNKIDTIKDLAGNASNYLYQATTGNKATFNATGGANNLPYAAFTNSAQTNYNAVSTVLLDTNFSFYMVMRLNTTTGVSAFLLSGAIITNEGTANMAMYNNGSATDSTFSDLHTYGVFEIHRTGRDVNYYLNGLRLKRVPHWTTYAFGWGVMGAANTFAPNMNFHEIIGYTSRNGADQMNKVRNYLFRKYGITGGTGGFFGDSWTHGSGVTNPTQRYSSRVCTIVGVGETNLGIPGTVLESIASPAANNGYDRRSLLPSPSNNPNDFYCIMYGGNDANNADTVSYNDTTFVFQLSTVVDALISKGWKSTQIILCNQAIFTGAGSARWARFANGVGQVAAQKRTKFADISALMGTRISTNNGQGGDQVHPTVNQADTIAKYIVSVLQSDYTYNTTTTFSSGFFTALPNAIPYVFTGTTSTGRFPPVSGNTGAYIYIKNRGSGAITMNSYAGANNIYSTSAVNTFSISAGEGYVFFNDGTYWAITQKY